MPLHTLIIKMFKFFKLAIVFLSLYAGHAAAKNSCRQCTGTSELGFTSFVTADQVKSYLGATLGKCATGGEYDLIPWNKSSCSPTNANSCKIWLVDHQIWRYCGNGGEVKLYRSNISAAGVTADYDKFDLLCTKSVECHGTCDCAACC